MKSFLLILASLAIFNFSSTAQDLVMTGVVDADLPGGLPKAVELHVINDIADLSIYGLGSANNGNPSEGAEFYFPADAATSGDYIYVTLGMDEFNTWFGFNATYEDTSGSALAVNGDDVIELFENDVVVDVYGVVGVDGTGEAWEHTDGWAYRKDNTGPSATFDPEEWTFSGVKALDGFMSNTEAGDDAFPIGTYERSTPVGLNSTALIASKIYPNPSKNGVYNLFFPRGHQDLTLKVFNLVGDVVYSAEISKNTETSIIRLSQFANGTYFLQVTDSFKNKESFRLLKW